MNGLTIRITLILLTFKHKLLQVPELFGPGLHQPLLEREAFRSSAQHDSPGADRGQVCAALGVQLGPFHELPQTRLRKALTAGGIFTINEHKRQTISK